MSSNQIALLISFILLHSIPTAASSTSFIPTDYILLDCGSSSDSTTSSDGRHWQSDAESKYLPPDPDKISHTTSASRDSSSASQTVPYTTARVFFSNFTYSFTALSPGHKFLRLYFYPVLYSQNFNSKTYFFSVSANNHTLLSNFSAFLTVSSNNYTVLVKEYIIQTSNQQLNITFSADSDGTSPSYAFVNGIEIVSIPKDLYIQGNNVSIRSASTPLQNNTSLEKIFRVNVGGRSVEAIEDTTMFRSWSSDEQYILSPGLTYATVVEVIYTSSTPAYTAPEMVYASARFMAESYSTLYNMTWLFPVDSGFYYLIRLHFCEISSEINKVNQRVFTIFINNQTVELQADVISWTNGRSNVAVFRDYVTFVADEDGRKTKKDLRLSMTPNMETGPDFANALLNGLEIFKISLSNGSLNSPNPSPPIVTTKIFPKKNNKKIKWWILIVTAGTVALVVSFIGFLVFRRRNNMNDSATSIVNHELPVIVNSICRHFSFGQMKRATCNFDENLVIGMGGFGSVYKGCIDSGLTQVAIKRLNPSSSQGFDEFQTEIELLSKLRHLHLVSLIGYCHQKGEMILVYDYMSRGTLRDHLYNMKNLHLPWKRRLQIGVGVARGIHYLHTGSEHTIIHRDIKSTNILLDENWVAKVSDFGLSKIGPISGSNHHISTMVKGSFGYLDPEYFLNQRLTDKSDVYSFGVVLLEMLCACPAITQDRSGEHISLAEWGRLCNKDGTLDQIIDPHLKGEIATNCLSEYVKIAFKCLKRKGAYRPSMPDVAWSLEFALQLQENYEKSLSFKMSKEKYEAAPSVPIDHQHISETSTSNNVFSNYSLSSLS